MIRNYEKNAFWTVYEIENSENGKCYIGITKKTIEQRLWEHIRDSKSDSFYALHSAIRKYGPEKFEIRTLEEVETLSEAQDLECVYIEEWGTYSNSSPGGYNMSYGGEAPDF